MRRVPMLVAATLLVGWLGAAPAGISSPVAGWLSALGSLPARDGYFIPHLECVGGQCVEVYTCGIDDCSACQGGCDPNQEIACIEMGGIWDPYYCVCNPPTCDPWEEQRCLQDWGEWDEWRCVCVNPCNAGNPELIGWGPEWWELQYCLGCYWGHWHHTWTEYWAQYCQDGRLWESYTAEYSSGYDDGADECWIWCEEA